MAQVGIKIIYFFSLFCLVGKTSADLSPEFVYEALSRRIDFVIQEIKSDLAETKSAVNIIENKIEGIQAHISASNIDANKNLEETSQSPLINDKIKNVRDISESLINTEMKRQSVIAQKMLYTEKKHLREVVQKFEDKFTKFESDMKSQMTLMNVSVESSVDSLEQSMTKHKIETNTSLVLMNTNLQYMMNETDLQIETMNVEFRNMMEDSDMKMENKTDIKLNEVRQEIEDKSKKSLDKIREVQTSLTRTSLDLQSAKSGISYRLNNAESRLFSMSSKLTSLEMEQDSQEDNFDYRISQLSSRISKAEARKVAFSARLVTKHSYYGQLETIVFDEVEYSHGGGYSSSTGIFTAPKSGTYLFTYNIESTGDGIAHVSLEVRGYTKTRAISPKGYDETGGNVGIAYLSSGDKVWVETADSKDKYYIGAYRTTFNGILID